MAAMTVSLDSEDSLGVVEMLCFRCADWCPAEIGVRYGAACQTNGRRIEMITPANIHGLCIPLVRHWVSNINGGVLPEHVYYFRDGVSEGQYQHVLQQELRDLRRAFRENFNNNCVSGPWRCRLDVAAADWFAQPKFVVVVASKRHHIRFFPKPTDRAAADRNANPLPGTLVEKDVTHPFENDFYLCSHSAIQGTARPVHYHVLLDEAGLTPNQLHAMIYEQCYAYIRSTTPVSLRKWIVGRCGRPMLTRSADPAIYYAHLASNRARHHENVPASSGPRSGPDAKKAASAPDKATVEPAALLPFADVKDSRMDTAMWYI